MPILLRYGPDARLQARKECRAQVHKDLLARDVSSWRIDAYDDVGYDSAFEVGVEVSELCGVVEVDGGFFSVVGGRLG